MAYPGSSMSKYWPGQSAERDEVARAEKAALLARLRTAILALRSRSTDTVRADAWIYRSDVLALLDQEEKSQ